MPKRRNWRSDWAICRRFRSNPSRTPWRDGEPDRPKPARPKASRNIGGLPIHLPREEIVIEPESDICPCCQGKLHRIGEDVSEMLDIVPAIIRVKRIRRPKYGCRACESAVVQAPAPPRPIDGGLPTAALLAHIAVSKFAWHLPLHRQTQMLAVSGALTPLFNPLPGRGCFA